jgi:hypothetical protein
VTFEGEWTGRGEIEGYDEDGNYYELEVDRPAVGTLPLQDDHQAPPLVASMSFKFSFSLAARGGVMRRGRG